MEDGMHLHDQLIMAIQEVQVEEQHKMEELEEVVILRQLVHHKEIQVEQEHYQLFQEQVVVEHQQLVEIELE